MALTLNTSHPLYSSLLALICVDDDGAVKDLTGNQTCSKHANCTVGSGSLGRHFRTVINGSVNAEGVALSPGLLTKPLTGTAAGSSFVVINEGNSRASRSSVFDTAMNNASGPGVYTGDAPGICFGSNYPTLLGSTDIIGTGAHSFGCTLSGTASKTFCDGEVQATYGSLGNASDGYRAQNIGGSVSGGVGGFAADYVWVAQFNRVLTDQEIEDLHASLGASNAFALVEASTPSATTQITATTDNAAFSGATVGYSASSSTQVSATTADAVFSGGATVPAGAGSFVTDVMVNNTGSVWESTPVVYEWRVGTGIGVAPSSVNYGTGTTSAGGVLTATGLIAGTGVFLVATTDRSSVYYQAGTVA